MTTRTFRCIISAPSGAGLTGTIINVNTTVKVAGATAIRFEADVAGTTAGNSIELVGISATLVGVRAVSSVAAKITAV